MSILSNGNIYDCYPNSGPLPRLELCNEGTSTGQVSIVTIRTDMNMIWEQPPQPIIPDVLAPTPTPTPTPVIVPTVPVLPVPPTSDVPVLTPDPAPTPIPVPVPEPTSSVPEPSVLYLVGPGLTLIFARRFRK